MLGVSKGSAHKIVESLGYHKVCAKWEPKQLTENQKRARVQCCRELRQMCESDQTFFERIVTGDETWIHYYEPETKQQSMEWRHPSSPKPKKFRCERSANKLLAVVFWDIHGVILIDFLPRGATMNSDRYIETLNKLKKNVYHERGQICRLKEFCITTTMPHVTQASRQGRQSRQLAGQLFHTRLTLQI